MEDEMYVVLIAVVSLFVSYFVIYVAITDAMKKEMTYHLKSQTYLLKYLAEKSGLNEKEFDMNTMEKKDFDKKYGK
jgi:hypothetical protein